MMQPSLKIFDIFYGNQCNLACAQCDTRSDLIRKKDNDPTIESIKEGILLAKDKFDIEIYSLLGGEPLLYLEKVKEIIEFIRSFDTTTTIMLPTNGDLISRNKEYLHDLLSKHNVLLMVSDHVRKFKDKTRSDKIKESVEELSKSLEILLVDSNELWEDVLSQRPLDEGWREYWKIKSTYFDQGNVDLNKSLDMFWWNKKFGIFLQGQGDHLKHYYMEDNKPRPFNSLDFVKAYFKSCPSCYCTFLYNKKLYKCAALGTLSQFLERHEVIDDPEWQTYLKYKPLDLENCTEDEVNTFSISKFKAIEECSMCPESHESVLLNEETVLPVKFYRTKN